MGWNIFYKECKYIAAHRMLKVLNDNKKSYDSSTLGADAIDTTDIQPTSHWVTLKELKATMWLFPKGMIKDVAFMLNETSNDPFKKEIDLLNSSRISEIRVRILWEGETALKDRKYWRLFFSSAKVLIPLLVGIATAIFGTIRCLI